MHTLALNRKLDEADMTVTPNQRMGMLAKKVGAVFALELWAAGYSLAYNPRAC